MIKSFYNTMWLIANDIIIGFTIQSLILKNMDVILTFIDEQVTYYTSDVLKMAVIWLMGWPAGLKLNDNLDNFLGKLYLQVCIFLQTLFQHACLAHPRLDKFVTRDYTLFIFN